MDEQQTKLVPTHFNEAGNRYPPPTGGGRDLLASLYYSKYFGGVYYGDKQV